MTLANERGVEGRGAQWANTGGQAQIKKVCFHTLSVNSHQRCDFTLNSIAVKVWFHTLSVNSHHWCDFTLFTQFFRKCDFTLWVWNHTQSVISHFLTYFTPLQRCRCAPGNLRICSSACSAPPPSPPSGARPPMSTPVARNPHSKLWIVYVVIL